MPRILEGALQAEGLKVALIVGRFNSFITDRLVEGAVDTLVRHGAKDEDLAIIKVPGAFEIPAVLRRVVKNDAYDAVLCLGAVIRGGTPHFDYVASEVSKGVAHISLETEKAIGFGVLTCDTIEQAIERAGTKAGNKGAEAALAVIELASVLRQL